MKPKTVIAITAVIIVGIFSGVGTYAWFRDSVSSTGNTINIGTLNIEGTEAPTPLFSSDPEDDGYVEQWYPGLEPIRERTVNIRNTGGLKAKIYAISAEADFKVKNPDKPTEWIQASLASQQNFKDNLIIMIKDLDGKTIHTATLAELTSQTPSVLVSSITLLPGKSKMFKFYAKLDGTGANNLVQGIVADVDLVIHAKQDNAP